MNKGKEAELAHMLRELQLSMTFTEWEELEVTVERKDEVIS